MEIKKLGRFKTDMVFGGEKIKLFMEFAFSVEWFADADLSRDAAEISYHVTTAFKQEVGAYSRDGKPMYFRLRRMSNEEICDFCVEHGSDIVEHGWKQI